ncbi:shufflon system plasmid conjugative transfer pilus tip adhesin PilV [Cupriavidus pauculus]|uniref:shufflon system plasmid conjugative transfer pilus tip adhesin PilV n=1 Tax=Cupriavidus pauculus TaxID=82633 RepID=UPI001FD16EFD|nr:shufflon system plasmid conjugative transfer pilus tip adhesin PilV [Cupriavidus pauculus]
MLMSNYAMGLALSSVALMASVPWTYAEIEEVQSIGTGNYMANIASAANTYTFEAFTDLAKSPAGPTNLTVGGKTIGVQNPLHPTIQDFINFGLLPIGYTDISPLGLSFRVDLTPTNCGADITACSIPGLVYSTTGYRDAVGRVRTDLLGLAVAKAGQDAGVSYAETPATITGMSASWSTVNPVAAQPSGVLAMRTGSSSLLAQSMNQFYKRDGSLNLTGPMDANNQAMNRVGNFQSNGSVSAAGNVAASGNVTGNVVAGNGLQSYGNASVAGTVSATQMVASGIQSYGDVVANASVRSNGYLYAAGALVPSMGGGQQVYDGQGCSDPQGAIRSDAAGKILSCQYGVWRGVGGGIAKAVAQVYMANCSDLMVRYTDGTEATVTRFGFSC